MRKFYNTFCLFFLSLTFISGQIFTENRLLESKRFDGLGANQATGGMNRYLELSLAGIKQQARPFDDSKTMSKDDLFLAEHIQPTAKG